MTPIVTDTTTPAAAPAGMPAASGEGAVFAALMAGQVANDPGPDAGTPTGNALPTARQDLAGVDAPPIIITPPDAYPDPEQVLQAVVPGLKPGQAPKTLPIIFTPPMPPVNAGDGAIQAPVPQPSPKDASGKTPLPIILTPPVPSGNGVEVQAPVAKSSPKDAPPAGVPVPPAPVPDETEIQAPVAGPSPKAQPPVSTTLPPQPEVAVEVQTQTPAPAPEQPKPAKPTSIPAAAILLVQSSKASAGEVPAVPTGKDKKQDEKASADDKTDSRPAVPDAMPLPIVVALPPKPEPQRVVLAATSPRASLPLPGSASDARVAPAPLPGADAPRQDSVQPAPASAADAKPAPFADLLTQQSAAPVEPRIVYPLRTNTPDNSAPAKLTIADLARSSASDAMARAQTAQPDQASLVAPLPAAAKAEAPLPDTSAPMAAAPLPQVAPVAPVMQPRAPVAAAAPVPMPVDTSRADWIAAMVDRIDEMRTHDGNRAAQIRLLPDALGPVDVRIEHRGDQMNVSFSADNPHARALLSEAAPRLAEMAEARGLKLGHTGVDQGQSGDRRPAAPMPEAPRAPRSAFADTDSETETGTADAGRIA